jgi:hypothetical protein
MNELDEVWSMMLAAKLSDAKSSGREDIAEYLALKQSNDAIRRTGIGWLFDLLIELASEAQRNNPHVMIEREEPHEFPFRGARLAGSLVRVRLGVRSLTIEAGWTRTPAHGFMRGGILAGARLSHFGMPQAGCEIALVQKDETPFWSSDNGTIFDSTELQRHLEIVLGE